MKTFIYWIYLNLLLIKFLYLYQAGTKTIDHVDLMREQLKILSGDVALSSSVLKRLSDEAANSHRKDQIQVIFNLLYFPF